MTAALREYTPAEAADRTKIGDSLMNVVDHGRDDIVRQVGVGGGPHQRPRLVRKLLVRKLMFC